MNSHDTAPGNDLEISLTNVCKWFGDFQVLRNICLEVGHGERIVICGPSGSGKSTLIRCLNGLENHQKGSISVAGTLLDGDIRSTDLVRRQVGMVFQQFNLFPHLSVLDNCRLALEKVKKLPRAEATKVAMEYLERVHIPEQANKFRAPVTRPSPA